MIERANKIRIERNSKVDFSFCGSLRTAWLRESKTQYSQIKDNPMQSLFLVIVNDLYGLRMSVKAKSIEDAERIISALPLQQTVMCDGGIEVCRGYVNLVIRRVCYPDGTTIYPLNGVSCCAVDTSLRDHPDQ